MKKKIVLTITIILISIMFCNPVYCFYIGTSRTTEELLKEFYVFNAEAIAANNARKTAAGGLTPQTPATTTPASVKEEKKCDHDYVSEITKQPTCAEEGETTYTCTLCGDTYTEPIEKLTTHGYDKEITKEPTCTEKGEATYTCPVCGDSYTEEIEALGHQYEAVVTKEPTCTEVGECTYTCSICGDSYTEEIPATGHTEGEFEVSKPAGWFTTGEQVKKCTVCGEILETETIPSQYPIWYLYVGIGVVAAIIIAVVAILGIQARILGN